MFPGSRNGSPRRNKSRIKLNTAVFAPIPSASVSTAIKVNPGDFRSWRRANLRSFISFGAQRLNRIDVSSAPRWQETREQSCYREQGCGGEQQQRIMRGHLI